MSEKKGSKSSKRLKERFSDFLDKSGLFLKTSVYSHDVECVRRKPTDGRASDFLIDRLLEQRLSGRSGEEHLLRFAKKELASEDGKNDAVKLLLAIEPRSKNDYSDATTKIMETLKPYGREYFEYVARGSFISRRFDLVEKAFEGLRNQEHMEALMERCIASRQFATMNGKATMLRVLNSKIRNKKKFRDAFEVFYGNEIRIETKFYEVIEARFDLADLIGATEGRLSKSDMIKAFGGLSHALSTEGKPFGIDGVTWKDYDSGISLTICGSELNKGKLARFLRKLAKAASLGLEPGDECSDAVRAAWIETEKEELSETLGTVEAVRIKKNKI